MKIQEKVFHAEEMVHAKTLRQEQAWHVPRIEKRPVWLTGSEKVGESFEIRQLQKAVKGKMWYGACGSP